MGKRPAAKSTAKKNQKPSPKAAKKPSPAKTTASRPSTSAPVKPEARERTAAPVTEARDVGRYTPQEIAGIGWRPFRYPPD